MSYVAIETLFCLQFMLGNVLFIEPDTLESWMHDRGFPVHPDLQFEPIGELTSCHKVESLDGPREVVHIFSQH